MQKSVIEEFQELKARVESLTAQVKSEALHKANEAIGVLRELGIGNDAILRALDFEGRAKTQASGKGRPPKNEPCPICNFRTDPPMTEGRTVVRRRRSPFQPKNSNRRKC
jgi:hypothetical protein